MVVARSERRTVRRVVFYLSLVLVGLLVPARIPSQETGEPSSVTPGRNADAAGDLVAQARSFMAAYADDLRRGDRAAITARYDSTGVHELRPGRALRSSHAAIADRYSAQWQAPAAFEWRDLTFEQVGAEAVLVSGLFAWTQSAGERPGVHSYVALLRRQSSGDLRIRLEAEAGHPPIPWALLGAAASVVAALALTGGWLLGVRRERRAAPRLSAAPPAA